MQEIDLQSWDQFEQQIRELRRQFPKHRQLIFRGLEDSTWPLKTTLERYHPGEMQFAEYHRMIATSEPHIRTFTRTTWDTPIETVPEIANLAMLYPTFDLYLWGGKLKAYGYMAHLRHLAFPSPLLDWTRSPYIAAFFAFRALVDPPPRRVTVLAYCEKPEAGKGWSNDQSRITVLGPHIRTHRRHFLQQGEYTTCLKWEFDLGWRYVPHQTVLDRDEEGQDLMWKFTIPWHERMAVLKALELDPIRWTV
jgi:hypothetical protein